MGVFSALYGGRACGDSLSTWLSNKSSFAARASTISRTSTSKFPRNSLTVITGLSGSGKSSLAFDTHLRRGPAPLRRIAFRLRAPVPRPDGAPGSRFHRRPFALHRHRAENHHAVAALHRRHHHRNLRLPARDLQLHRHAALPELRQAHLAPVHRADCPIRSCAAVPTTAS